jgi:hypothetical protein
MAAKFKIVAIDTGDGIKVGELRDMLTRAVRGDAEVEFVVQLDEPSQVNRPTDYLET